MIIRSCHQSVVISKITDQNRYRSQNRRYNFCIIKCASQPVKEHVDLRSLELKFRCIRRLLFLSGYRELLDRTLNLRRRHRGTSRIKGVKQHESALSGLDLWTPTTIQIGGNRERRQSRFLFQEQASVASTWLAIFGTRSVADKREYPRPRKIFGTAKRRNPLNPSFGRRDAVFRLNQFFVRG